MDKIKIVSLNARGLREEKKIHAIFHYLRKNNCDIACLQETHSTINDEKLWQNEWGGEILFNHGTNNQKRGSNFNK